MSTLALGQAGGGPPPSYGGGGASPYALQGGLNFGGAGAPNPFAGYGTAGYPQQAGAAYQSAYNAALGLNSQNYQNIMAGYGQLQGAVGGNYDALVNSVLAGGASVGQAYQGLSNQVQGQIQGVQQSQLNANQAAYAQQTGSALQGLSAAGLGNTTVGASIQSGLLGQKQLADTAVQNQFAQLEAGYMSQLGSAGIQAYQQANQQAAGYQAQGIQAQTGIGLGQLGFEAGINIPYPNAQTYGSLVQSSQQAYLQQLYGHGGVAGGGPGLQQAPSSPQDASSFQGGGHGFQPQGVGSAMSDYFPTSQNSWAGASIYSPQPFSGAGGGYGPVAGGIYGGQPTDQGNNPMGGDFGNWGNSYAGGDF